ncbi:Aste57867_12325 [Aphanomyces stellatus]|uniref:Aste57867_12325 protein n=1 Tax=Aphanomyces stellatus TaxID=120398 RepID=A0A485KV79_9STRA|nr:hypothetical protein As57867_012279 [Aphanomyces stellatus]VFT89177.1 Aste57867_12325 [Aphanomyces stellatus]
MIATTKVSKLSLAYILNHNRVCANVDCDVVLLGATFDTLCPDHSAAERLCRLETCAHVAVSRGLCIRHGVRVLFPLFQHRLTAGLSGRTALFPLAMFHRRQISRPVLETSCNAPSLGARIDPSRAVCAGPTAAASLANIQSVISLVGRTVGVFCIAPFAQQNPRRNAVFLVREDCLAYIFI